MHDRTGAGGGGKNLPPSLPPRRPLGVDPKKIGLCIKILNIDTFLRSVCFFGGKHEGLLKMLARS